MASTAKPKTMYYLYIVRAELSGQPKTAPDVYVKIDVEDFTARTRVVRKTWTPSWNEQFKFLALPSCILHLKVKRQSKFLDNIVFGHTALAVGDLVKVTQDAEEVRIDLDTTDTGNGGRIVVRAWDGDVPVEALAAVVAEAHEVAHERLNAAESVAANSLSRVVKQLGLFVDMGDAIADVHPYVSLVWQATTSVYNVVRSHLDEDEKVLELMAAMEDTYAFVDVLKQFPEKVVTLEGIIKQILQQTFECALFVQEYAGCGFANRAAQQAFSASSSDRIDAFTLKFAELKRLFDMSVTVQTGRTLLRALTRAETTAHRQALETLKPANMDLHGRAECLPGTRLDVIAHLIAWATSPSSPYNVFWLNGVAGSGKSTLATSIATFFQDTHRLGAFLFFNRDVAERSNPSNVVRTIAYQLGVYDSRVGDAVSGVLQETPSISRGNNLLQFTKLLVETLCALDDAPVHGPVLIVLDGMDECGNERERKGLLQGLAMESAKLPSFYRILVTSRPEHDIRTLFEGRPHIRSYRLSITSDATRKDIVAMLQFRLGVIRASHESPGYPAEWPGEDRIQALADRASGLFVWASTACKFIDAQDPEERLSILLLKDTTSDAQTSLDSLYLTALESAGRWEDSGFSSDFRDVVGTLLVARNPLSAITIDKLLPMANQKSFHAISRLGCLFYSNAIIRLLHPSFAEFLSDQSRCQSHTWFIDVSSHNTRVAIHCMDLLQATLKFNLCGLTLSRDFSGSDAILPDDTVYACMFWIEHVCAVGDPVVIEDRLVEFLFSHLLHWLEAMSLLRGSRTAVVMLRALFIWHEKFLPGNSSLRELIHDGYRFSQSFVEFIETHPLLIYTAALPFTPVDTILYRTFHDPTKHPWLSIGYKRTWSSLLSTLPGRANLIRHIAFSPDGERVATGSLDNLLQLWDLASGLQILPSLPYGSTSLDHVTFAFSSDGAQIASVLPLLEGDSRRSITVYDTRSGAILLGPLDSSNGDFSSILFSPDNSLLACIINYALIVWDATSGSILSRLSTKDVASLAFSPNSSRIVCGSSSMGSIIVQDARTSAILFGPLYGHKSMVSALHVRPNGVEVVSVGDDGLIILWDILLGTQVHSVTMRNCPSPLPVPIFSTDGTCLIAPKATGFGTWNSTTGESLSVVDDGGWVSSLTVSPDGLLVASASENRMACLWTTTGSNLTGTIDEDNRWHIPIETVAYSPDGTRIALVVNTQHPTHSLNLIHVIDAQTSIAAFEPIAHHAPIRCLAFSNDGSRIVSGSEDCGIRLWDSTTGVRLLLISEGHALQITSVAFSFDDTKILSTSRDNTACVWDTTSGAQTVKITIPRTRTLPTDNFSCAALSPDGTKIVSCTEFGEDIRVWHASTGSQIIGPLQALPFRWRKSPSVGFSADGSKIFLKASQCPRREWNAETGMLLDTSLPGTYTGGALDDIVLNNSTWWIINVATQRRISKLPITTASAQWTASCKTSVTIATKENFLVMHFPKDTI